MGRTPLPPTPPPPVSDAASDDTFRAGDPPPLHSFGSVLLGRVASEPVRTVGLDPACVQDFLSLAYNLKLRLWLGASSPRTVLDVNSGREGITAPSGLCEPTAPVFYLCSLVASCYELGHLSDCPLCGFC